jgi:3-deoxy-D-manno-octulosonic acid kinase
MHPPEFASAPSSGHDDTARRGATEVTLQQRNQLIVYDPALIEPPDPAMFDPGAGTGFTEIKQAGRQAVHFLRIGARDYVLRHYWRGGQAAKLSRESYLWLGADRSRPFREWRLLDALRRQGLPVPRPAAARLVRSGPLYRGDILTERLAGTRTLAELAAQRPLSASLWERTGATLRRFHDAGAYHADLNASNVLIDEREGIFLIDWDRGRLRRPAARWRQANLARLARSLAKFARRQTMFYYSDSDWQALMRGYERG